MADVRCRTREELTDSDPPALGQDADHGRNLTARFRAVLARMDTIGVIAMGKAFERGVWVGPRDQLVGGSGRGIGADVR